MSFKIGHGIDIHKLSPNIPLILGGLTIPSKAGSQGHSDGDVVIHALVDAILGALALGDIGTFFPSNNKEYKNADSSIFLEFALKKLKEKKYEINNIDINIVLETPKLNQYIIEMKKSLCNKINSIQSMRFDMLSIKATTTDKLGFIGSNQGIMSTATILIQKNES